MPRSNFRHKSGRIHHYHIFTSIFLFHAVKKSRLNLLEPSRPHQGAERAVHLDSSKETCCRAGAAPRAPYPGLLLLLGGDDRHRFLIATERQNRRGRKLPSQQAPKGQVRLQPSPTPRPGCPVLDSGPRGPGVTVLGQHWLALRKPPLCHRPWPWEAVCVPGPREPALRPQRGWGAAPGSLRQGGFAHAPTACHRCR